MRLRQWREREIRISADFAAAAAEIEFAQSIADRIVEGRLAAGLTQTELAKRANTTQARISEIEAGEGNPTVETISKIFAALGLTATVSVQAMTMERAKVEVQSTPTLDPCIGTGAFLYSATAEVVKVRVPRVREFSGRLFDESAYAGIEMLTRRVERVA